MARPGVCAAVLNGALRGGEVELRGELDAQADTADIDARLTMDEAAVIHVGGELHYNGPTSINDGQLSGSGMAINDLAIASRNAKIVGGFERLTAPLLSAGLAWDIRDSPTDVTLNVVSTLWGDFSGDLHVDGSDFGLWSNHFGTTDSAPCSLGDGDGDGDADGGDFLNWQRELGTMLSAGNSALTASVTSVPEPSSLLLALAVLGAGWTAGRRAACSRSRGEDLPDARNTHDRTCQRGSAVAPSAATFSRFRVGVH